MKILLSNDDGVYAAGLNAIYKELKKLGDVFVVAPLEERSTMGHSITIHKPLRILEIKPGWFGVSGSPADCVLLGIREVMKKTPDLIVSGVNRGANLGQDIYYSGTVSAAREACIMKIPSIAVSLAVDFKKNLDESKFHYETAAVMTGRVLALMKKMKLPKYSFLNLNVPNLPLPKIRGIRLGHQGFRYYGGNILKRKDHRGKNYYWLGAQYQGFHLEDGTDCDLVDAGFASLTPLKLDCTDHVFLEDCVQMMGLKPENPLRKRTFKGKSLAS